VVLTKVVFGVVLCVLPFVVGCPPAETVEPGTTTPIQTKPAMVEPQMPEPAQQTPPEAPSRPNETPEPAPPIPESNEPATEQLPDGGAKPNLVEAFQPEPNTTTDSNNSQPQGSVTFHNICAPLLEEVVSEDGRVDYTKLKLKRPELRRILNAFARLERARYDSWPEEDKIAFWINAYNLQLLNIIQQNYPIQSTRVGRLLLGGPKSIRNISGIWDKYKFIIMDEQFTLSEIEKRIFKQNFTDPRIFLALSRASVDGPPLRREPYTGAKLSEQLDEQVRRFLSNRRAFRIDRATGEVYLSALFERTVYGSEFLQKYKTEKKFKNQPPAIRAVLNFVSRYVPPRDASFLEVGNYTVKFSKYDWTVNDN